MKFGFYGMDFLILRSVFFNSLILLKTSDIQQALKKRGFRRAYCTFS